MPVNIWVKIFKIKMQRSIVFYAPVNIWVKFFKISFKFTLVQMSKDANYRFQKWGEMYDVSNLKTK